MEPPKRKLPTWLLTVVFALVFVGVVFGIYSLVSGGKGGATKPSTTVESPAAKSGAPANPLQKYIEISGVRFVEGDKKKIMVRFAITNHSEADLAGLGGNVTVWGRTQKSEEDAQGTFAFSTNLRPFEMKELTAPMDTKLKIYELPDWQNVTTDVQITAPSAAPGSVLPQ